MATTFKHTPLFGGAITADIPSDFGDVSSLRQIPDNQEVYLQTTGFTSLTIDLCERVTDPASDTDALHYHFSDLVGEGDTATVVETGIGGGVEGFGSAPTLHLHATTTTPAPTTGPPRPNTAPRTTILLTLIRLEELATDVLVVVSVPHMPPPEGEDGGEIDGGKGEDRIGEGERVGEGQGGKREAKEIEAGKKIMEVVARSLVVRDWSLFGPGVV